LSAGGQIAFKTGYFQPVYVKYSVICGRSAIIYWKPEHKVTEINGNTKII